ncbi:MAG: hypothetical protein WC602_01960 [archaeon]
MSKKNDGLIQDANVRLTTTKKYQAELGTAGITAENIALFEIKIGEMRTQDTSFHEKKNLKSELTKGQDAQIGTSKDIIKQFRAAAQIAFYGDKTVLREFNIGQIMPRTVKKLATELPYLKEVAGRYAEALKAGGITPADIAALETSVNALLAIDAQQEDGKHAQKTQKSVADAAAKVVREMMFKINKAASICFMHDKPKLDEFKSIIPKKKAKPKTTNPTPPDVPPTQ